MSANTSIDARRLAQRVLLGGLDARLEWCDSTFNPWTGCTKVSPGCDHCYAEGWAKRSGTVQWGPGAQRRRTTEANWRQPLKWEREAAAFEAAHGRRQRVFCASLADWLDNHAPIEWLVDLLDLVRKTPSLDWLLLSKRIGNWRSRVEVARDWYVHQGRIELCAWMSAWLDSSPPANVWLGATVVNQAEADRDIQKLLQVPARVRFLSVEPMLGPITLRQVHSDVCEIDALTGDHGVLRPLRGRSDAKMHWVICGGESGPGARPMEISWARGLARQCKDAGVAFHMKQLGAQPRGWCAAKVHAEPADREDGTCDFYEAHECSAPCTGRCAAMVNKKGGDMAEWPEDLRVREFPR